MSANNNNTNASKIAKLTPRQLEKMPSPGFARRATRFDAVISKQTELTARSGEVSTSLLRMTSGTGNAQPAPRRELAKPSARAHLQPSRLLPPKHPLLPAQPIRASSTVNKGPRMQLQTPHTGVTRETAERTVATAIPKAPTRVRDIRRAPSHQARVLPSANSKVPQTGASNTACTASRRVSAKPSMASPAMSSRRSPTPQQPRNQPIVTDDAPRVEASGHSASDAGLMHSQLLAIEREANNKLLDEIRAMAVISENLQKELAQSRKAAAEAEALAICKKGIADEMCVENGVLKEQLACARLLMEEQDTEVRALKEESERNQCELDEQLEANQAQKDEIASLKATIQMHMEGHVANLSALPSPLSELGEILGEDACLANSDDNADAASGQELTNDGGLGDCCAVVTSATGAADDAFVEANTLYGAGGGARRDLPIVEEYVGCRTFANGSVCKATQPDNVVDGASDLSAQPDAVAAADGTSSGQVSMSLADARISEAPCDIDPRDVLNGDGDNCEVVANCEGCKRLADSMRRVLLDNDYYRNVCSDIEDAIAEGKEMARAFKLERERRYEARRSKLFGTVAAAAGVRRRFEALLQARLAN
ncbi:hypothetical protein H4R20_005589 [Coemansia guatemalensis]|uniref:Uncharacterized protein n=1 Tax=Coemansia guatemalensis TaxID=2761395 RepID=A0A9W8HR50_9FUNG|nr:hypothetical protein H4R20_005589 [Coemansia guatemalensis]